MFRFFCVYAFKIACSFLLGVAVSFSKVCAQEISLTAAEIKIIGERIFANECAGDEQRLTWWNEGEDFASLGIGHFIWYPKDNHGPFHETFPELLGFIKNSEVKLPDVLKQNWDCPWNSRAEFVRDLDSPEMLALRKFLKETVPLQAEFLVDRLQHSLPKILEFVEPDDREIIQQRFYQIASKSMGVYALTDYVNFKGEGILETERYQSQGWGLLQALQEMRDTKSAGDALQEFARATAEVLIRRVENAPKDRNEQRWLPGWKKRIATYIQE